ncbi:MAG: protein translocase subunit SecF [Candidatus Rokuibacteriota bacterium]|nr:MAG: protein translocase subunit SecF [Candidatus Rokubacteria bacterium]
MLQIFTHANYDFVGKRRIAYAISIGFTLLGLAHIAYKGGLAAGIDFSGGTLIQVRFAQPVKVDQIRAALDGIKLGSAIIQRFGDPKEYLIRTQLTGEPLEQLTRRTEEALTTAIGKLEVRRVESVGPQVGRDLQIQALYAVLAGMAGILIYVAFRFDFKGGVAAVIALIHDVIVTLGAISLTNREMSLPVLAALLTIVGYSINDTIVVFDRIRENRGRVLRKGQTIAEVFNTAMNQTLSRTMLTSLTVFLTVLVLYMFGGEVLRDFAFALLVGVITGTYSSVFVAVPIVVDWENWLTRRERAKKAVAKA